SRFAFTAVSDGQKFSGFRGLRALLRLVRCRGGGSCHPGPDRNDIELATEAWGYSCCGTLMCHLRRFVESALNFQRAARWPRDAKIILLLPVRPGNVRIVFRARSIHSVAHLYSPERKSRVQVLRRQVIVPPKMLIRFQSSYTSTARYLYKSALATRQRLHKYVLADVFTKSSVMQKTGNFEQKASAEAHTCRTGW
ncbi:hypothetical protein LLEC1_00970, partial [Akanthomyces lecanii]